MKEITGKLLKLGDNISTVQILSQQYHDIANASELANHVLEGLDNDFPTKIKKCKVLVAGSHFGSGESTTQAVMALKATGINCIVAKSFGRAFFRYAMNHGLLLVVANIMDKINDNDNIIINFEQGKISYPDGETNFPPYPEFVCRIVQTGDVIVAAKKELGKK